MLPRAVVAPRSNGPSVRPEPSAPATKAGPDPDSVSTPIGGHTLSPIRRTVLCVTVPVPAVSSRPLPVSARGDLSGAGAASPGATERHTETARACLHDEVVPALTAAMLRLHLLVETSEEARQLGAAAIAELERAAAGVHQVMTELARH